MNELHPNEKEDRCHTAGCSQKLIDHDCNQPVFYGSGRSDFAYQGNILIDAKRVEGRIRIKGAVSFRFILKRYRSEDRASWNRFTSSSQEKHEFIAR